MKRFTKNTALVLLLANFTGLLFFEGVARLLAYYGAISFRYYPTFEQRVLADLSPHFGIWRYPDRKTRHRGACYDVSYETNSFGMRDRNRDVSVEERPRHVVLGDSFVEGFGVEAGARFTNVLEDKMDAEFLNFGVSGSFSSTQQYLLYRELASDFSHDSVAIFFLPDNDFTDNNPAYFEPERYRPYLRRGEKSGEYEVFYTVSFADRDREQEMSRWRAFRRTLYNNIYLLNAVRQMGDLFESSEIKDRLSDEVLERQTSSYARYSEDDLSKLVWGYERIARLAHPRPVHIFVIPREVDFETLDSQGAYESAPLITDLRNSALNKYPNVHVYDLLPFFKRRLEKDRREYDDIFLPCDGHWSRYGHEIVAKVYREVLGEELAS